MDITSIIKGNVSEEETSPSSSSRVPRWKVHGSHMVTCLPPNSRIRDICEELADPETKQIKVAAFDLDDTLICTKSGIKFGKGAFDWKWRNDNIVPVLRKKVRDKKFLMVVFTNQGSISVTQQSASDSKSYKNFTNKLDMILRSLHTSQGPVCPLIFAATGRPGKSKPFRSSEEQHTHHRKPETGMWEELERYILRVNGSTISVDYTNSFFVGDAAGREGDHSAVDLELAKNIGIQFFTPEEFFGA